MEQYISKSALIAEMNKLKDKSLEYGYTTEQRVIVNVGKDLILRKLLDYIDTLEVKEVDIEKEVNEHWDEWAKEDGFHSIDFAKYFFELGLLLQTETNITFKYNIGESVREYNAQKGKEV